MVLLIILIIMIVVVMIMIIMRKPADVSELMDDES